MEREKESPERYRMYLRRGKERKSHGRERADVRMRRKRQRSINKRVVYQNKLKTSER